MSEKNPLPGKTVAVLVVISMLSGLIGAALFSKLQAVGGFAGVLAGPTQVVEEHHYVEESESIDSIKKVVPAVISIVATKDLQVFQQQPFSPFFFPQDPFGFDPFGQQQQPQQNQPKTQPQDQSQTKRQKVSGGTGFILQSDGLGITNRHVVADTQADFSALTKDGKEYDVEVISRDPVNDLAVFQLHEKVADSSGRKTGDKKNFGAKPTNLPTVSLGDSSKLQVGQKVLAIGNARGEYENSVTAGIISATERQIQASDQGGGSQETLSGLIQTDAAINFGNSGGPLINIAGEVIGMNTAVDASATGVGFAIPVNQIKPVIESVKKFGHIVRPVLGVMHMILTKEKAKELKLDGVEYGALITGDRSKKEFGVIPGSPADKAGLRIDDVILEVDGQKVTEANTLQSMVQSHAPKDKLKLKVWRAGSTFEVTVTLDEKKE